MIKSHSSGAHITVEHQRQELVIPIDSVLAPVNTGNAFSNLPTYIKIDAELPSFIY